MSKLIVYIARFWLCLIVTLAGTLSQAQTFEFKMLEDAKRYDHIVTLSLYQLMVFDCQGACRDKATLNAMRASILQGDNSSALLVAGSYLGSQSSLVDADSQATQKVRLLQAYAHLVNSDGSMYANSTAKLSLTDKQRLYRLSRIDAPFLRDEILDPIKGGVQVSSRISREEMILWEEYENISRKSSWVAGLSNLLIPGSGYFYLGMWQTGALNALLTGLCLASSIELFQRGLPASGAAVASVGSVFYIGGALGAARSANDINQKNAAGVTGQLRRILLPELSFEF